MSLTKKILLSELAISKPEKLPVELFGHPVYVKAVSEFQRSRRLAAMTDEKGKIKKGAIKTARLFVVIDHLCDKDGEPLFTDDDVKNLGDLDALKLDILTVAIEDWVGDREGKIVGGSKG